MKMASDVRQLLQQQSKKEALISHENDTTEQLKSRVVELSSLIIAAPSTEAGLAEATKFLGEMEACTEILSQREAQEESIKDKKKQWKNFLQARKEEAILHLETAVSPNGQLVAAILEEEDGKTAEELAGWCDELAQLPEEDFRQLLKALVDEGILREEEGAYYLLTPCTEDLHYTKEAWKSAIDRLCSEGAERIQARGFLWWLESESEPWSIRDFKEYVTVVQGMRERGEELGTFGSQEFLPILETGVNTHVLASALQKLCDGGVLEKVIKGTGKQWSEIQETAYYQFAVLGERRK